MTWGPFFCLKKGSPGHLWKLSGKGQCIHQEISIQVGNWQYVVSKTCSAFNGSNWRAWARYEYWVHFGLTTFAMCSVICWLGPGRAQTCIHLSPHWRAPMKACLWGFCWAIGGLLWLRPNSILTHLGSSLVTSLLYVYVGPRLGHLVGYVWAKKGIQLECVCLGPMLGHFI